MALVLCAVQPIPMLLAFWQAGYRAVTVNLTIDYRQPVPFRFLGFGLDVIALWRMMVGSRGN